MHSRWMKFVAAIGLLLVAQTSAGRTPAESLQAGAARVEITPAADALPGPYSSVLDPLYARAIFLENGQSRAVLLNADVGAIPTSITDNVTAQIVRELNVPAANIFISAIFGGAASPAGRSARGSFELMSPSTTVLPLTLPTCVNTGLEWIAHCPP